jgi:hypothetical protein
LGYCETSDIYALVKTSNKVFHIYAEISKTDGTETGVVREEEEEKKYDTTVTGGCGSIVDQRDDVVPSMND